MLRKPFSGAPQQARVGAVVRTCGAKLVLGLWADLDQLLGCSSLSQGTFPARDAKMGARERLQHLTSVVSGESISTQV